MTVEELLEIERIRALREAYARCLDARDVAGLAELFCADAVAEFPDRLGGDCAGKDAIARNLLSRLAAAELSPGTVHVVTNPWIILTGPDSARGSCYLIDLQSPELPSPASPVQLIGRYEDEYRRVGENWRFTRIRMPLLWEQPAPRG